LSLFVPSAIFFILFKLTILGDISLNPFSQLEKISSFLN